MMMNEPRHRVTDPWAGAEVIFAYTRAQAIEDGVLVDLSEWAREAGFRFPLAVTSAVWGVLKPGPDLAGEGQDVRGRAWDMLTVLRFSIAKASRADEVRFAPLFVQAPGRPARPCRMWAKCGPGDHGEPVITVMLEGED